MTTKKNFWYYALTLLGATAMLFSSCNKDNKLKKVTDIDGNEYKTVSIGSQEWFTENLRTTKYNNGNPIPTGYSNDEWSELSTGAYAIYSHSNINGLNSDAKVIEAYGLLYNWYAAKTGNLCPIGWRVPTDADWTILVDFLGGESIAGGKLKSKDTAPDAHPRWDSPNSDAKNENRFSALPGGFRKTTGNYEELGSYGFWLSSTENNLYAAWSRRIHHNSPKTERLSIFFKSGLSVRCIKEN